MLRCFFLSLFLAVGVCAQIPVGATKKEVIDKLGWPTSTSSSDQREILNYPAYSVLLQNGRVTKLQWKPKTEQKRPAYQAPVPAKPKPITPSQPIQSPVVVKPRPPVQQTQVKPSTRRPVLPPPDPFAGAKKTAVWLAVGFGIVACLKLWLRAMSQKEKADRSRFSGSAIPPKLPQPSLLAITRPEKPAKPDPLTDGWSLALLKKIEWHRFEQVVAAYEREMGNDAELTDFGPDGGIDVRVFETGSRTLKRVIQCKAFDNQKVGVELVRSFYGAMTLLKVSAGAFYTTSVFSEDALRIGRENEHLELVDGQTFINRIQSMALSAQICLFEVATEGDYATPTCASCGVKMILKPPRKGRSEGSEFWGCRNYPRCRSIIKIAAGN